MRTLVRLAELLARAAIARMEWAWVTSNSVRPGEARALVYQRATPAPCDSIGTLPTRLEWPELPLRKVSPVAVTPWHTGAMASIWGMTPRQSIEAECARRGRSAVVSACVDLLQGQQVDDALVLALGGPHARYVLSGGDGGRTGYWPRVWACRGLLYAWEKEAAPAIVTATRDEAWRVREMAAKVIARHRVEDAIGAVVGLQGDPVPRVRAAAERAVIALYDPIRT